MITLDVHFSPGAADWDRCIPVGNEQLCLLGAFDTAAVVLFMKVYSIISVLKRGARESIFIKLPVNFIPAGEGVERKFPLHSPKIAKIVVKRSGVTRRAKLYYLRDRVGKAVRLRERRTDAAAKATT